MKPLLPLLMVLSLSFPHHSAAAQQSTTKGPSVADEASAAYDAKDWTKAAELYRELSRSKDAPPRVWLRLGAALRALGQYDQALAAFEHANEAGAAPFADYGRATIYAAMKQIDKAFASLEKSVQQGYAQPETLTSDPEFTALRSDPRFIKLVEQ